MSDSETEPVDVRVIEERDKSYLLATEGKGNAFFPKSEVSFKSRNTKTGVAVAVIPLWLLEKKGW